MPAVAAAGGLPSKLGKFEIVMPLAAGGMARIYVGRTTGIGSFERHVVLKLILPERANDSIAVGMFLDEARLAASLNHQNVAQVFEVGEDAGIHYLAMEYVHGQDLRALLAKAGSEGKRVPLELALTVVAGAAAGLNHAHDRRGPDGTPLGIVHRDVSPSNIMIGYDGSVKLLDFGIAKATARSVETQSGIIKGKFAYMAPEQCRGRDVDRRSDVFSLGIILYEISTQHRCFRADSDFDTMHRIVTGDVVRPSRLVPNYPAPLEAIVMKALAVDAAQRYQSAGALLEALEAFSVASRMSLSQMALGRFMREMFGDVGEPWLQSSRQAAALAAGGDAPRESTISNTNGTNDAPRGNPVGAVAGELGGPRPPVAAEAPAAPQPPRPAPSLDLPRGASSSEPSESQGDAWNAKSYPAVQPTFGTMPLHAEAAQRQQLAAAAPTPPAPTPPAIAAHDASGSTAVPRTTGLVPASAPVIARTPTPPPMKLPGVGASPAPVLHTPSGPLPLPLPPPPTSATPPPGPPMRDSGPIATGSQPLPPAGAFQTPGSHSGAAIPMAGVGYQSGPAAVLPGAHPPTDPNNLSYPRYERSNESALVPALDDSLKPNRRPIYIGLGVAGVALIIIIAMVAGGGGGKTPVVAPAEDAATAAPGSDQATEPTEPEHEPEHVVVVPTKPAPGSNAAVLPPVGSDKPVAPTKGSSDDTAPVADDLIAVHIETPSVTGAEVELDGKLLGKTPLDIKVKRGSAMGQLIVKKDGYVEATRKVDLSGDFSKVITLSKKEEAVTPPHHEQQPPHHEVQPPHHEPQPPKCQKPGPNVNPFSNIPICKS